MRSTFLKTALLHLILWPVALLAHMQNMYDTERLAELRLTQSAVELRMQLGYKEFPGLNVRLAMDRDADNSISNREAAIFCASFLDSIAARIELTADGKRLELAALREPTVELYDSRGIIPQHCDITLELSAPIVIERGSKELQLALTGRDEWPYQGKLTLAVVAGRTLEVKSISLPDSGLLGPEQLDRVKMTVRARDTAEKEAAIATGERDWRIVRYAQTYYFPGSLKTSRPDSQLVTNVVSGGVFDDGHDIDIRTRVRDYLEKGRGGLMGLWLILLAAFAYGAVHALAPGHAKTLTAAYLVGSRHGWPHAAALAGVVTATHTGSILALAVITKLAWGDGVGLQTQALLGAISGLIVLVLGIQRLRGGGGHTHNGHEHHHEHDHSHGHSHTPSEETKSGYSKILWLGFAGGLAPCPGAIWVFFLALGFGQPGLGIILIVAMSLGLALVLLAVGLATIYLRGLLDRREEKTHPGGVIKRTAGKLVETLPTVAGTALVLIGSYLIWNSMASIGLL